MKNLGTIAAAVFLGTVLVLYLCTFQVRFTEVAVVKTWGKPADAAILEPGLQFKWPPPIQNVVVYDKRIRTLEDRTEETRTQDSKNVIITTFTLWKIGEGADDPIKFLTNFRDGVEEGADMLRTTIMTQKHAVIGKHLFDELVSTNPQKRKLKVIEEEIRDAVATVARGQYGIEVVGFGIKKLALPKSVTTTIFENMKANENKEAQRYESEGESTARDIVATARAAQGRIMAAAREKVAEIEAEAEQRVSEYYREFDEHPELRIFLDTLRTYTEALQNRTTLIIDTETKPWDLFTIEGRQRIRPVGSVQHAEDETPAAGAAE